MAPVLFNGTTWDRLRNLLAGSMRYALGVGLPIHAAVQTGALYTWDPTGGTVNIFDAPNAATNVVIRRLRNPKTSTKMVTIHRISILANVARLFEIFVAAPALTAFGTSITTRPRKAGAGTAQSSGSLDNTIVSTPIVGDDVTWGTVTQANVRLDLDMLFQLPPDSSLDLAFNDANNATTDRFYASLDWSEEPIV